MADDKANPQQTIQTPKGVKKAESKDQPVIFTMPEKFRHGAPGVSMAKPAPPAPPKKAVPAVQLPPPPPPPPPAIPQAKPMAQPPAAKIPPKKLVPKKKSRIPKVLVMVGVILLIVLGIGGFLFIRSLDQPPPDDNGTVVVIPPCPEGEQRVAGTRDQCEPIPEPCPEGQRRVAGTRDQCEPIPEPCPEGERRVPGTTDQCEPIPVDNGETPFPQATQPGVDTDSDGLTDVEERIIYKTNARLPDTDKDGFLDGNEVFHRYDPNGAGGSGVTLQGTGAVTLFVDSLPFTILYPTIWSAKDVSSETETLLEMRTTTGEKIVLEVIEKSSEQNLASWITEQGIDDMTVAKTTKNGFDMVSSDNQLIAYVDLGATIVRLYYDTGIKTTIDYLQTFQMMINSMETK